MTLRLDTRIAFTLIALASVGCGRSSADDPSAWMTQWGLPELESGAVTIESDTTVFSSAPASMVIDASLEQTKGSITRGLAFTGDGPLVISATAKLGEGMGMASIAVTLVTDGGGESHPVLLLTTPGDWQEAAETIDIPEDVGMVFLTLTFEGQGKLWLDDFAIKGALDPRNDARLNVFGMPFGYAYGAFDGNAESGAGIAHIDAPQGRGGAGFLVTSDLSPFADQCPVLTVKRGPNNQAAIIKLTMDDSDGDQRAFEYDLSAASTDEFSVLFPVNGIAVSPRAMDEPDISFDADRVSGHQLQGPWTDDALDVFLESITFADASEALLELRQASAERARQVAQQAKEQAEREAAEIERVLTEGGQHPEDGPEVQRIAPVAPDILALTIQERWCIPGSQAPYALQDGDEVRTNENEEKRLAWADGVPALVSTRTVWRDSAGDGRKTDLGILSGDGATVTRGAEIHGTPLSLTTLMEPRAYRIQSGDDAAFGGGMSPVEVYRKSKPLDRAGDGQAPVRHVIYLKLSSPLQAGAAYTISLWAINTRQAEITYTHAPSEVRTEALHVTQIGYRPDDPFKRAYLSTWLGTGGRLSYAAELFEVVNAATGEAVYRGDITLGQSADDVEMLRPEANHTRTDVYYLDFHEFSTPGTYRVVVPGIGSSYDFTIDDGVWTHAFTTSMHGLLCHRSGLELGPPITDYIRPRPFHPADGMKIFRLDITMLDGESDAVNASLRRLLGPDLDATGLKTCPDAWGGYMDAGDWDRRSQHLHVTYLDLELFSMFPEYFDGRALALPENEANNALPDLIDEALWNLDFYRRLQEPDGGVCGGVESTAHPKPGEASWQESQLVGCYAPDPVSSLRYAAVAAKAARVVAAYDDALALEYRQSAESAWAWAEANGDRVLEEVRARSGRVQGSTAEFLAPDRALAGAELYGLTSDEAYHAAYRESCALASGGDPGVQLDAIFAYAALPTNLGEDALRADCLAWLIEQGEQILTMSGGNSFNIGFRAPLLPMMGFVGYFTTPESAIGPVLPRLHYLTGDAKWLQGAVAVTQYTAGANPVNITMTTGLGHDYPRAPLHVDSDTTGGLPPRGITIYGPHDPNSIPDWVKTWIVGPSMAPPSSEWPAAELHVDESAWPEMSEYTVHQSIGPTGYYWGYLAARGR